MLAQDGRLHRDKFGRCIGTREPLAVELFDTLARRRNISGNSITKAELTQFCNQISGRRLETFFDMVEGDGDVRISSVLHVNKIMNLNAPALTTMREAREIMEDLDHRNLGYVTLGDLMVLLRQLTSHSVRIRETSSREMSRELSRELLRSAVEPKPNRFQLHGSTSTAGARHFLREHWRLAWALLLWFSACAALFAWKFVQYRRRRGVFQVMGYCACVDKGAAETLKLNMALVLLPVCRGTATWARNCAAIARVVPFDDSLCFHLVIAAGIVVAVGLHAVSQLACGFPRLHASTGNAEYAQLFDLSTPAASYWRLLKGTEGWTGVAMVVLMSVAFTLATPRFRRSRVRLPRPLNRLLTGFNTFWYTHHLLAVAYALLVVHGHFLYLRTEWYNKTTWMYLAVPVALYACERLLRALRSRIWHQVKIRKVEVYPGNVLMLLFSKPRGFAYKSGQYIQINCPAVSALQWHPFYITSAPQDDYISVHIRTLGDWTSKLKTTFAMSLQPPVDGTNKGILLQGPADDDASSSSMSKSRFPKVLIDGPYGASVQDYKRFDVLLLIGLGIGAAPMISVIKDIVNSIKPRLERPGDDLESGGNRPPRAYFHWATREQRSADWFRSVVDEVATVDQGGTIDVHIYCTDDNAGDRSTRFALRAMLKSLSHVAKHGVDVSSRSVKTHFARPNFRSVFKHIAVHHRDQRVGVFCSGPAVLTKNLRELSQELSRKTSTRFKFHKAPM